MPKKPKVDIAQLNEQIAALEPEIETLTQKIKETKSALRALKKEQMKGHRDRVRDRYYEYGMDAFQDYEALELLLFYAIPFRDTKELAKKLISHFGSLHGVFDASLEELQEVLEIM